MRSPNLSTHKTAATIANTENGEANHLHRGSRMLNIDDRGVIVEDTTSVSGTTIAGTSAISEGSPSAATTPKRGPSKHYLSGTCLPLLPSLISDYSRILVYQTPARVAISNVSHKLTQDRGHHLIDWWFRGVCTEYKYN